MLKTCRAMLWLVSCDPQNWESFSTKDFSHRVCIWQRRPGTKQTLLSIWLRWTNFWRNHMDITIDHSLNGSWLGLGWLNCFNQGSTFSIHYNAMEWSWEQQLDRKLFNIKKIHSPKQPNSDIKVTSKRCRMRKIAQICT